MLNTKQKQGVEILAENQASTAQLLNQSSPKAQAFRSGVRRYGLALGLWAVTVIFAAVLSNYSIRINLTILVVIALIVPSWYGGKGPGLLVAILFEVVTIISKPIPPPDTSIGQFIFGHISISSLYIFLVLLVSSRRKAEKQQQEQREWLQVTLSSIGDAVIATDVGGRINFMNAVAESLTGWSINESRDQPLTDIFNIIDETTRQPIENPVTKVLREGTIVGLANHTLLITKDGHEIPIDDSAAPIRDNRGQTIGVILVFHNVSEKKLAANALRESEERFRLVVESVPNALLVVNRAGKITLLNSQAERLFGYTSEELLGGSVDMLVPEKFRGRHAGDRAGFFASPEVRKMGAGRDLFCLRKDGSEVPVEIGLNPLKTAEGEFVLISVIDITERKNVEQNLIKAKNLTDVTIDSMPGLFYLFDQNLTPLRWNKNLEQITGYTTGEIAGMIPPDFFYDDEKPLFAKCIEQAFSQGEASIEAHLRTKNGGRIPHFFDVKYLILDGKQCLLGTAIDISERKRAEEAISEANERAIRDYERLLQRLAMLAQKLGIARDLQAVFSAILEFTTASVPCVGLFISLYDREQSVREGIYFWYHGEEIDISELAPVRVAGGPVGQTIESGEVAIFNDYQQTAGKKPTYVYLGYDRDARDPHSAIIAPMKIKGNVIGTIEVQSYELNAYRQEHATGMRMAANLAANAIENVRLLQQERQSAEQLRLSQKLESVGRLAGGIAHDFNNMLTAITGYSELTLRHLKQDDPLRHNIEEIKRAGERSALLTHQLLAFSRKQVLKPVIADVNQIVTDITAMLRRLISEDIILNIKLDPQLGQVMADPGQLSQVIMNLVVNARDAMPEGGNLTIETSNICLDKDFAEQHVPTQPGSYVMLSISDTGIGMSEETQQHVFEPFYTTKEVGKGTGLGLATVYGIVKQSDGYVWFESRVGQGTRFNVYLPRVDEETIRHEANSAPAHIPIGSETILLVEDEEIVRSMIYKILEDCGYKVIEARGGAEALSICREADYTIDLLITDVVMPKFSGLQLVEQLKSLCPDIKVLYISGYTDDKILRQGITALSTNFIQKPFTSDFLAQKVRELLDTKNGSSAA